MKAIASYFSAPESRSTTPVVYRVHRKHGRVFALLPDNLDCQRRLSALLPAQSPIARLYRLAVRWLGVVGCRFPRETTVLHFDSANPLVRSIRSAGNSTRPPMLLPGNPHGPTPRLILIALAEDCSPAAVFKAGNTEEARRMVHREYEFLRSAPAGIFHLPAVRDLIEEKDWTAFSMEFVHGNSPGWPASDREIESVLTSWIDTTATVRLADTRPWKELAQNLESGIPGWFPEFGETRIHPCLFHGDFAPWNVRIDATGRWSVIDWERGERQGVPGWDWLHFDIQSALLLKRPNPTTLIDLLRQTVFSPSFQNYLRVSRLPGREELLVLSYLLYCEKVFRPHGLIEAIRELRHLIETTNPFPSRHVEAGTV